MSEARYFGEIFGRPFPERLPRFDDPGYANHDQLWVTEQESRADIIDGYKRAWRHADGTIEVLPHHLLPRGGGQPTTRSTDGLFLHSSICWGEFFPGSDIDFVGLWDRLPTGRDLDLLQAAHESTKKRFALDELIEFTQINLDTFWRGIRQQVEDAGIEAFGNHDDSIAFVGLGPARLHHLLGLGRSGR